MNIGKLCGGGCKNIAALEREGQITIKRYHRDHARADFVRVQGDRDSVAKWAEKLMQDYPAKGSKGKSWGPAKGSKGKSWDRGSTWSTRDQWAGAGSSRSSWSGERWYNSDRAASDSLR